MNKVQSVHVLPSWLKRHGINNYVNMHGKGSGKALKWGNPSKR